MWLYLRVSRSSLVPHFGQATLALAEVCESMLGLFYMAAETSRYKARNSQMETWLRAHGFAGPGLPEFRLPPQEVKALVQEQRFRQRLDKLLGGSSDRGLPDPEQYLTGSSNSPTEYRPARLTRTKASEATKAPATPHPKPRQSPATPLKPAVTRRRYTRKMPPR